MKTLLPRQAAVRQGSKLARPLAAPQHSPQGKCAGVQREVSPKRADAGSSEDDRDNGHQAAGELEAGSRPRRSNDNALV